MWGNDKKELVVTPKCHLSVSELSGLTVSFSRELLELFAPQPPLGKVRLWLLGSHTSSSRSDLPLVCSLI